MLHRGQVFSEPGWPFWVCVRLRTYSDTRQNATIAEFLLGAGSFGPLGDCSGAAGYPWKRRG
jgi:hypothetical protein